MAINAYGSRLVLIYIACYFTLQNEISLYAIFSKAYIPEEMLFLVEAILTIFCLLQIFGDSPGENSPGMINDLNVFTSF